MALDKHLVDARNVIYRGSGTVGSADYQQDKDNRSEGYDLGTAHGGSGGFPWFRGRRPSPYNPNGSPQTPGPRPPNEPAPEEPPFEEQGPPDLRQKGGIGGLLGKMDAKDVMALLAALSGTVGVLKSTGGGSNASSATTDPAMQEVLALMAGRLKKSEPMFDSVQSMANGLLPTAYQNRGGG